MHKFPEKCKVTVAACKRDESKSEKLLTVKLFKNLTFDDHISDICKIQGTKITSLAIVTPYIELAN